MDAKKKKKNVASILKFTGHPLSLNPALFGNHGITLQGDVMFPPDHLCHTSRAVIKVRSKHLMHIKNGNFFVNSHWQKMGGWVDVDSEGVKPGRENVILNHISHLSEWTYHRVWIQCISLSSWKFLLFLCVVDNLQRWLPWTTTPCIYTLVQSHPMLDWGQPGDSL